MLLIVVLEKDKLILLIKNNNSQRRITLHINCHDEENCSEYDARLQAEFESGLKLFFDAKRIGVFCIVETRHKLYYIVLR
jgi:hypothetical protein